MKLKNQANEINPVTSVNSINSISPWRLLALFVIINLVLINLVNYWSPFNHDNIQEQFESKQSALLAGYDLQQSLKAFKNDPDVNAFNLIQKSVAFSSSLNKYGETYQERVYGLSSSIEQAVAKSASLKSLVQNVENTIRNNKNLKQKILNNLSEFKNNDQTANIIKNSLFTIDKIDSFLQSLKYIHFGPNNFAAKAQENIEAIGLETDQINNLIENNSVGTNFSVISDSLEQTFNELNVMMPELLGLMELNSKIMSIEQEQNNITNALKSHQIGYIYNLDSKTIIIFTIIFTNILLLGLILFIKIKAKTQVIYNDYKNKKEIYFLSHINNLVNNEHQEDTENKSAKSNRVKKINKIDKTQKINKTKPESLGLNSYNKE